ncbi:hypothetical protein PILCRDRAFT_823718 [Piloderma croceum F 1598]|uniref:Uncharacterized protein n=1 Tax=Piloderma croceum (strain F 1598) TaxID=765440 RepID=A0A0C3BPD1_PILCF|nr:hypothetical protein PILCRDRAFT_823718 [Piloderma croceum F 1598]
MNDALNTLLLFPALFSTVNATIFALSIPSLNTGPVAQSATPPVQPLKYAIRASQQTVACPLH